MNPEQSVTQQSPTPATNSQGQTTPDVGKTPNKRWSECTYYTSMLASQNTYMSGTQALLVWTYDDQIQAYLYDKATSQYTNLLINISVKEIERASSDLSVLILKVQGKNHRFDLSSNQTKRAMELPMLVAATGGIAGAAGLYSALKNAQSGTEDSGIDNWLTAFRQVGIDGVNGTQVAAGLMRKTIKVSLISFGVLIVLIILIFVAKLVFG